MTDTEYSEYQNLIMLMASALVNSLPTEKLDAFIARGQQASDFGCFQDPTLYMRGIDKLSFILDTARALLEARGKILRSKERYAPELKFAGQ